MKTNKTADVSGNYDDMDVILIKKKGAWASFKRWLSGYDFDDAAIVLELNNRLFIAKMIEGRLAVFSNIAQWRGFITHTGMSCTLINLPYTNAIFAAIPRSIGHKFPDPFVAIASVFDLENPHSATPESVFNSKI